jgi:glycogen synthase
MLSWEYPPHMVGGIGTHVKALVPALAERGVEVTLVTPRWEGGEPETRNQPNISIFRVEPSNPRVGNYYADAKQTNLDLERAANAIWPRRDPLNGDADVGYDLVHAHDWLVAFAAIGLKGLHKVPLVATIHATERGRGRGNLPGDTSVAIDNTEWWLTYQAWRVITVSQFMADEVRTFFKLPSDKVEIVPNGVEIARLDHRQGDELERFREHWARKDEKIILFVGRLELQKGPHLLVEAAARVLSQLPDAKFILAGTGGMETGLRKRVSELGLTDQVLISGFLPDRDRDMLYRVADLSVFPSLYEPFGIVALEAMAAECPVVVSDVGGLREVVQPNETGIVVERDNIDSLAQGILDTLGRPDLSARRAANAVRAVSENYTWERIADRTIQIYSRVLRERRQVVWE